MATPASQTITLRIIPIGSASRRVGFDTFVSELQAIHGALVRADKLLTGGHVTTRYELAELSLNSPARVVLSPRAIDRRTDRRTHVMSGFVDGLQTISRGESPDQFDRPMLEKIREIASGVSKRRVRTEITYGEQSAEINHIFERRVIALLERTERAFGSVEGRLEALNLHADNNTFVVYPTQGAKKVICHFQSHQRDDVKAAIDKFVVVTGMLDYSFKEKFPHRIAVRDIQTLDEGNGFPRFEELRGIARDAWGDIDSADLIRQMRDVWR